MPTVCQPVLRGPGDNNAQRQHCIAQAGSKVFSVPILCRKKPRKITNVIKTWKRRLVRAASAAMEYISKSFVEFAED
eukprot:6306538-Amphidinium_carterae.1